MGRNSSRSGESQDAEAGSTADATETTQVAPSMGPSESLLEQVGMSGDSDSPGPDVRGQASPAQYEAYYGVEIDAPGEVDRLQRLEESNTLQQVREWADEGMPVAAMGEIPKMEAFRERKGTPVPWDAERRNEKSKRRNTSPIQRATHGSPAGETGTPESVREVLSSPGRSLDASIQRAMEDRMGDSLGDVRIHTGPKAAKACDDIDARAFTVGNHVAFNQGEYDPESPEGQHVLAHELAHVRQQTGGAVSMLPQDDVDLEIDPDLALEREAEETAELVMAGGKLGIQRLANTELHVQRSTYGEDPYGDGHDSFIEEQQAWVSGGADADEADPDEADLDVNLLELAKKMGKGAGLTGIPGCLAAIVRSGGIEQALQNPEGVVVVAGVVVPASTVLYGWSELANQLGPGLVRRAFAAAGKEELFETILERFGGSAHREDSQGVGKEGKV